MPLRRDQVDPLTPLEEQQEATRRQVLKDKMIKAALPRQAQLPRTGTINQPEARTPGKGIRSKNSANVIDLRFLETDPRDEAFEQGLAKLNAHRLAAGTYALDREQLAKEYPKSLAGMVIKQASRPPQQIAQLYPGSGGAAAMYNWERR